MKNIILLKTNRTGFDARSSGRGIKLYTDSTC